MPIGDELTIGNELAVDDELAAGDELDTDEEPTIADELTIDDELGFDDELAVGDELAVPDDSKKSYIWEIRDKYGQPLPFASMFSSDTINLANASLSMTDMPYRITVSVSKLGGQVNATARTNITLTNNIVPAAAIKIVTGTHAIAGWSSTALVNKGVTGDAGMVAWQGSATLNDKPCTGCTYTWSSPDLTAAEEESLGGTTVHPSWCFGFACGGPTLRIIATHLPAGSYIFKLTVRSP